MYIYICMYTCINWARRNEQNRPGTINAVTKRQISKSQNCWAPLKIRLSAVEVCVIVKKIAPTSINTKKGRRQRPLDDREHNILAVGTSTCIYKLIHWLALFQCATSWCLLVWCLWSLTAGGGGLWSMLVVCSAGRCTRGRCGEEECSNFKRLRMMETILDF